jgi:hypothetical protein
MCAHHARVLCVPQVQLWQESAEHREGKCLPGGVLALLG